ncbi:unnamed protein product [Microthlaspi erraticum]|uniref:Pectinesterase inhibitor domain-containing protein n=1 Tax=Microthlaspi erraticum TaxID=1685480 RepID=A0A6D2HHN2_9BRAS|nr:unnamed protein product [Microthlaspi erraticum]
MGIQTAFSQSSDSPSGPKLIQQLCKRNRYQSLCNSTLSHDPRSKAANLQGLGATIKTVNESLTYFISVFDKITLRPAYEIYGTCIEDYGRLIDRLLPTVLADIKAKNYTDAMSNMEDIVFAPNHCENQFPAGTAPLPVTQHNKAAHDIADMTADIIKTFVH